RLSRETQRSSRFSNPGGAGLGQEQLAKLLCAAARLLRTAPGDAVPPRPRYLYPQGHHVRPPRDTLSRYFPRPTAAGIRTRSGSLHHLAPLSANDGRRTKLRGGKSDCVTGSAPGGVVKQPALSRAMASIPLGEAEKSPSIRTRGAGAHRRSAAKGTRP